MGWVISVTSSKLDRRVPGLTVVGQGANGCGWRYRAHAAHWQATVARHVITDLIALVR
jgi:hypothetical protein